MTLLAHQTDVRFPSIAKGEARVHRLPLVEATAESLKGFGEIVPEFRNAKVKMVPWPLSGRRAMSPGVSGNEAGETEGAFSMWAEGGVLFGRNEAVQRAYIIGWYDDPALASREREPHSRGRLYIYQANYHPDGGQIWCPRDGTPFVAVLGRATDDVTPDDFVAFRCDGSFGIQILPSVWHQPAAPVGPRMTIDNKQGKVHACVDFDSLAEFGCYLEVPLS
jgi:ureidoglycolate lyase/seryl-tRNA synthetase